MPFPHDHITARLASRIRMLLVGLALALTLLFTIGGWLLLIEAEDSIQDSYLRSILESAASADPNTSQSEGISIFKDPDELMQKFGLQESPQRPGMHEMFTDETGGRGVLPRGFMSRIRLWLIEPREHEFRIWYQPTLDDNGPTWVVADLESREFSEANLGRIRWILAAMAFSILIVSLLASSLITRWALLPILALALRVRLREKGHTDPTALAAGMPDDEVGYLARVLDSYHDELRETLERERRIIADCSHELRNPVTILNGAVALLRELPAGRESNAPLISRIERSGKRMERLIQTFLVMAREKRTPISIGGVPVEEVIQEVVREWKALHPAHPLIVSVKIADQLSVRCHRECLAVLAHNLIGNAFSHLPGGNLLIEAERPPTDGNAIVLNFIDDGPGLPEFAETGEAPENGPGYGLGLALVDRLCSGQGWTIKKALRPEGGTSIRIKIPDSGS